MSRTLLCMMPLCGDPKRSRTLSTPSADFDSPWKEALEEYLEDFLALFFPQAHAEIDWIRPPIFRDGELQDVA